MEKRIHLKFALKKMQELDARLKKPVPFSFQYAKKDGSLKTYEHATLSSMFSKGATVNILLEGESRPHTFRKILITRFNDYKVYI